MNLSDYIATYVLSEARGEYNEGATDKYVTSAAELLGKIRNETQNWGLDRADDAQIALRKLCDCGLAIEIKTPHAQPRYVVTTSDHAFNPEKWDRRNSVALVVSLYKDLGHKWLLESILGAIDSEDAGEAEIDADYISWEPLPLERPDAQLDQIAAKLEELEVQVRTDNGYAHDETGERDDVLVRLKAGNIYLKNASRLTAEAVYNYIFSPLRTLIQRFGPAAIGAASKLVLSLFESWLKQKLGL